MLFQIGDRVVHPVHGVGTVKTLSQKSLVGEKVHQYYEVATDDLTVFVPVDGQGATVLRAVASRESLGECRQVLRSRPAPLENRHQMRQLEIGNRLKSGSLSARCGIVRDLTAHSWQRPLSANEDMLLRKISKALCDEWAAAEGVSPRVALDEIEGLLAEARAAWDRKNKV